MKNMYFCDINPRNMRRLMNIVAVTGERKYNVHSHIVVITVVFSLYNDKFS